MKRWRPATSASHAHDDPLRGQRRGAQPLAAVQVFAALDDEVSEAFDRRGGSAVRRRR
ncbi:hypothetical protein [Streptosporangium subroseum]|uniref:hypothetical protein n=1 Tax=Streptosporangium subroseum TaxID=106412 RepID=UPI0015C67BAD|nr:hypothetical protein [Streptosporangium subroseum]